jgi:hypothetical protein
MVNGVRRIPRVRLDLRVRLRRGECAELGDDPVTPGRGGHESAGGFDGFALDADVDVGVVEVGVDDGGVEGVCGSECDVAALIWSLKGELACDREWF